VQKGECREKIGYQSSADCFRSGNHCIAVACGSGGVEGKYRDSSGTFNAEFKHGKAYIAMGAYAVDGTYKIEGAS
jgi:hypothetical protein